MSGDQSYFRLRLGDFEFEWQGNGALPKEIQDRLVEAIQARLKRHEDTPISSQRASKTTSVDGENGNGKKTGRGGTRKASISKGLDELVDSKWLVRKPIPDVVAKLKERFPGANYENVKMALTRRLNRTLVRNREGDDWVFSIMET